MANSRQYGNMDIQDTKVRSSKPSKSHLPQSWSFRTVSLSLSLSMILGDLYLPIPPSLPSPIRVTPSPSPSWVAMPATSYQLLLSTLLILHLANQQFIDILVNGTVLYYTMGFSAVVSCCLKKYLLSIPQSGGQNVKTFRWDHKLFFFFFPFFFFNLTYSRWTSSLPSCLWPLKIFPSLPGSRLTIFLSRCKFDTLTTRQPMVEFCCKDKTSSWHLNGLPDGSNFGSKV